MQAHDTIAGGHITVAIMRICAKVGLHAVPGTVLIDYSMGRMILRGWRFGSSLHVNLAPGLSMLEFLSLAADPTGGQVDFEGCDFLP